MINPYVTVECNEFARLAGVASNGEEARDFYLTRVLTEFSVKGQEVMGSVENSAKMFLAEGRKFFVRVRNSFASRHVEKSEKRLEMMKGYIDSLYEELARIAANRDRMMLPYLGELGTKLSNLEEEYEAEKNRLCEFKSILAKCGE